MNTQELLQKLRHLETELWVDGEQIRYRAPQGQLTGTLLTELKRNKQDVLQSLRASHYPAKCHPLSPNQRALWFLYQLAPDNVAYNTAFAAQVRSPLDPLALQQALQRLTARHPVLRSTFHERDGKPVQTVHSYQDVCFEQIDASRWSGDDLKVQVDRTFRVPFNLEKGPVMRVSWFHRRDHDGVLLIALHHIVCDGWSMWTFLEELQELYGAQAHGFQPSLPPIDFTYADFVEWQSQMLAGSEGERLWRYWQQKLKGELPLLNLPTDRPRPPVQTYNGAACPFELSSTLAQQLKQLAQAEGTTLFTVLLAAFQVLLYRYTGQEDILVGSPTAGRTQAALDKIMGYLANPVALRAHLSDQLTFQDFLAQVRQTVIEAIAHQDYPFPLLVEQLQPERDPSRSPLFQTLFVLQKPQQSGAIANLLLPDRHHTRVQWGGLELEAFEITQQAGQFDLSLEMLETQGPLVGTFKYNTDLFEATTVHRFAQHFQTLLAGIIADPSQAIAQLPLLTPTELQQVLGKGTDTPTNTLDENSPPAPGIHQLFEEQVVQTPDTLAVGFEDQALTYHQLNQRANQLAHHLQDLGVGPDVLVGICVERSLEMVIGLLAILKAGGAYVPLDPTYPQERLAFMLSDSKVPVLVTQEKWVPTLPACPSQVVCLDTDWPQIAQASDANPLSPAAPHHLAYIIYTSGSTGQPKGVRVNHANVVRLFTATQPWFNFGPEDVWTLFHSYAFDFSVWELWGALLSGGKLVVVPYWVSRSPDTFYELLCTQNVTVLNQTPSAFRQLIQADATSTNRQDLKLRFVIFGGEALELQSLKPWFDRHGDHSPQLVNMYGITETTVHVTYRPLTRDDLNHSASVIGSPIPDLQVYVLDSLQQPVPIGVPGEMYIGGAGVTCGYLNRPELTAERFIPDPFSQHPGARLYKSGDLARTLPNGELEYLGRIDKQVKIRGFRIELGEIEAALIQHGDVQETVVIAREDQPGDKRIVAYVVPRSTPSNTSGLRQFLANQLPDYMIPAAFVLLEVLPLTANGKVDHKALPLPDQRSRAGLTPHFVAPRTPEEDRLAGIWSAVLDHDPVGIHDNFFALGGDSIRSIQVLAQAKQAGLVFSLEQLFQHPTIAELAQHLSSEVVTPPTPKTHAFDLIDEQDRSMLPGQIEDAYPLTALQTGMLFHSESNLDSAVYHDVFSFHLQGPPPQNSAEQRDPGAD